METKRKPYSISLDEDLMREAKKRAIDERKKLYEFVEDAIRQALSSEEGQSRKWPPSEAVVRRAERKTARER